MSEFPGNTSWIEALRPVEIRTIEEPYSQYHICPETLIEELINPDQRHIMVSIAFFLHVSKCVKDDHEKLSLVRNVLFYADKTLKRLSTKVNHNFMDLFPTVEDLKDWISGLDENDETLKNGDISKEGYQILKKLFVKKVN